MTRREQIIKITQERGVVTVPELAEALGCKQNSLSSLVIRLVDVGVLESAGRVNTESYSNVKTYKIGHNVVKKERSRSELVVKILELTSIRPMTVYEIEQETGHKPNSISNACMRLCKQGDLEVVGKKKNPVGYLANAYAAVGCAASFAVFDRAGKNYWCGVWF